MDDLFAIYVLYVISVTSGRLMLGGGGGGGGKWKAVCNKIPFTVEKISVFSSQRETSPGLLDHQACA